MEQLTVFLKPPRAFWSIPNTDVRMDRSKPFYQFEEGELKSLTQSQKRILELGISTGTLAEVTNEVFEEAKKSAGVGYILDLPIQEIQKSYIGRMEMAKDLKSLEALLDAEKSREAPRSVIVSIITDSINRVKEFLGADYSRFIKEIDDDKEGTLELDFGDTNTGPELIIGVKKRTRQPRG